MTTPQRTMCILVATALVAAFGDSALARTEYRAFSMKTASDLIQKRVQETEIRSLGGIRKIAGLVFDEKRQDVILVGELSEVEQVAGLDELVVALRAALTFGHAPEVSIDRAPDTEKTLSQVVRFEAGIEDTRFGQYLLDADVVLKKVGLGKLRTELFGVASYLDMSASDWRKTGQEQPIQTRFWFIPDKERSFAACRAGVGVLRQIKIKVQTEVTGVPGPTGAKGRGSLARDLIGDRFAEAMTASLEDLADSSDRDMRPLKRLDPLFRMTGVAETLKKWKTQHGMDLQCMNFWLDRYAVAPQSTPKRYELVLSEAIQQSEGTRRKMTISGGVQLANVVRDVRDGAFSAFKELVIKTRPSDGALTWPVPLGYAWDSLALGDIGKTDSEDMPGNLPPFGNLGTTFRREFQDTSKPSMIGGAWSRPATLPACRDPAFNFTDKLPRQSSSPTVGGVMLSGAAQGQGAAQVDLAGGNFSLVVGGENAQLDPKMFRKFVTALWAVYFGRTDPGISIDPIYQDPKTGHFSEKHMVWYIGRVVNTDLGRVMREADYVMKKWSVGTERADIPGFKNPDDYSHRARTLYASLSRFWLTPENMKFKTADNMLLFDGGNMRVKTQVLGYDIGQEPSNPHNEAFAKFFSDHYAEIARKYPVYQELNDYGKLVALAKYLKDSKIPLFWFLIANKDQILIEDSPGTVNNLAKKSDYWEGITVQGGVEMGQYVIDKTAAKALDEAVQKGGARQDQTTSMAGAKRCAPSIPFSFGLGTNRYSVVPQHSLTCGKDRRGIRYQTDLCLRAEGYKVTDEVVAVLQSSILTYAVQKELAPILDKMSDKEKEQKAEKLIAACYEKTRRTVKPIQDKVGRLKGQEYSTEAQCGNAWEKAMADGDVTKLRSVFVQWCHYVSNLELVRYFNPASQGDSEFGKGWRLLVPYCLKTLGKPEIEFLNIKIAKQVEVQNLITGDKEIFTFNKERSSYVPDQASKSAWDEVCWLGNGARRLTDKIGSQFEFDGEGYMIKMALSPDHVMQVEYVDDATEAFDKLPYLVDAAGDETVLVRGGSLPKRMKVVDVARKTTEILVLSNKGDGVGYVPEKPAESRYRCMTPFTDGSHRLTDKQGNQICFTASGVFERLIPGGDHRIVRSITSGGHKVAFDYAVGVSGQILIAGAKLFDDKEGATPTHLVRYEYDGEGRLCRAKRTAIGSATAAAIPFDTVAAVSK